MCLETHLAMTPGDLLQRIAPAAAGSPQHLPRHPDRQAGTGACRLRRAVNPHQASREELRLEGARADFEAVGLGQTVDFGEWAAGFFQDAAGIFFGFRYSVFDALNDFFDLLFISTGRA